MQTQKIANHYLKILLLFCDDIVADIASNTTMFPFFTHFQCQKKVSFLTVAEICLHHMQMVKLVFSDSLKCDLSHDIYLNIIFSRRHVENLTRKKDVKNWLKPEVVIY